MRIWCFLRHPSLIYTFYQKVGRLPNPAFPQHLYDKYLWRKIFDHNPLFTQVSDKLLSKEYAKKHSPGIKTAQVLWTGRTVGDIPKEILNNGAMIKTNHGSGQNVLARNGDVFYKGKKIDPIRLHWKVWRWLSRPYRPSRGEWSYSHVKPTLFAEEILYEAGKVVDTEYKCYAENGRVSYVYVQKKQELNGELISRSGLTYEGETPVNLPKNFKTIIKHAEKLSAAFDHIRVDLYEINDSIYFSELTVYCSSGFSRADEVKKGTILPKYVGLFEQRNNSWDMTNSWFLQTPQTSWKGVYAKALLDMINKSV